MTKITLGLEQLIQKAGENPKVTGVRVFTQYCLLENMGHKRVAEEARAQNGAYFGIQPTVICQSMTHDGIVFEEPYIETFPTYIPIETSTDPEKVAKIGETVESRAHEIADYVFSRGLKVVIYSQNPPSISMRNNIN